MSDPRDDAFDALLASVLRIGVLVAAIFVACGGAVFLVRHGLERPAYDVFKGEPPEFRSVHGIADAALHFSGRGIIQAGLLLLIATPIARVLFSVIGFVRQRDWLYVAITLLVLTLLGYILAAGS